MDDYVSFDIAKKLKKKGFNKYSDRSYTKIGLFNDTETYKSTNEFYCYAPTIYQVLKWLREKKEVDLVIEPIFCYDKKTHREYGVRVFAPPLNKPVQCGYFNKWEKASIAGIKYVLDKLI